MAQFKVGDLVVCEAHPEWGNWGVIRDCGEWFEIRAERHDRILFKCEAGWRKA